MKKHAFLLSVMCALSLTACDWFGDTSVEVEGDDAMMRETNDAMMQQSSQDAMMEGDEAMMEDDSMMQDDAMMGQGEYAAYSDAVLANGETKVLFFHAGWCPICKAADAKLMTWYATATPGFSVYKIDYDASSDLKAKYGVTYQHTFVLVDGEGNMVRKIQGPTDDELKEMIGA